MIVWQNDKLTRVYRDYDEDNTGVVSQVKKESLKLSERNYIVNLGLIISDDEGEDEEDDAPPRASIKKRMRCNNGLAT